MRESVLRVGSVDLSWLTGDGWKSKSGRSLDGTPVGVDGVYGVLAAGASRGREAARVTSFQEFREPHVHCLDAPFLKILPRAAVPGHVEHIGAGFFGSLLYFSQASGDLLEFDFPPSMMTSMSFDVIGVGGVELSTLGSSSLKWTSCSTTSWEVSASLVVIKSVFKFFFFHDIPILII